MKEFLQTLLNNPDFVNLLTLILAPTLTGFARKLYEKLSGGGVFPRLLLIFVCAFFGGLLQTIAEFLNLAPDAPFWVGSLLGFFGVAIRQLYHELYRLIKPQTSETSGQVNR